MEQRQEIEKQNQKIKFNNRICCDKKAYFFRYIYPVKGKEWDTFCKTHDETLYMRLGATVNELYTLEDYTSEQKATLYRINKHAPLFRTKCTMQYLVDKFSVANYNLPRKNQKTNQGCIIPTKYQGDSVEIQKAIEIYKKYLRSYRRMLDGLQEAYPDKNSDEYKTQKNAILDSLFSSFVSEAHTVRQDVDESADVFIEAYKQLNNQQYGMLLWRGFAPVLVQKVKENSPHRYVLEKDDNGVEYFGEHFVIKDIQTEDDNATI